MSCTSCAGRIDAADPYCRWCGAPQPVVDRAGAPTAPAPPLPTDIHPSPQGSAGSQRVVLGVGVALLAVVLVVGVVAVSGGSERRHADDGVATATTAESIDLTGFSFPPPPPVPPPAEGWNAETLAATFGDAVWRVEVAGCGLESGGTAFAISPHHLVTNWHVVILDTEPTLVSRSGEQTVHGHVIGLQKEPDLALIEVDEPLPRYLEWAPTGTLTEGQELVAIGYPRPQKNFTVTQLRVASFETEGETRAGILASGPIDRGNSGGPSLTLDGKVAGVNTKVNINSFADGGLQTVPYLVSADAATPVIDQHLASAGGPTAPIDCAKVDPKEAETYGDNDLFDELWELCDAGDAIACDALARNAPAQTDYYLFGVTCGGRVGREGYCTARYGEQLWPK